MRPIVLKQKYSKPKHRLLSFLIVIAPLSITYIFIPEEVGIGFTLTSVATLIAGFLDDAAYKLKVENENSISIFWGSFGMKFDQVFLHKQKIKNLKIAQLDNRHFALVVEMAGSDDLVLIEKPTKKEFKEQLKKFSEKISGSPFFENLGLVNHVEVSKE